MVYAPQLMSRSPEQCALKGASQKLALSVLCSALMIGSAFASKEEKLSAVAAAAANVPVKAGCETGGNPDTLQSLLKNAAAFANPPVYDFTNGDPLVADLQVSYQKPVLAGCETRLRQFAGRLYDQRPVAPTMLIRPSQTYQANIVNMLRADAKNALAVRKQNGHDLHGALGSHGGQSTIFGYVPPEKLDVNHNTPGNFDVTNLHTHGWHVKPTENHDNIFAAIGPGDPPYLQQVHLPEDHVAGTFWYHAHVHGSTTIQVASGMAGALIVKDPTKGLDAIPQIAAAQDLVFVLQQLAYDTQGVIESYDNLQQGGYSRLNRPVFVNGQAYPRIQMLPGEVQRWRFIHAGITDGIKPALVSASELRNSKPTTIPLYEIALDGLPTGTMPQISNATMSPGYRVDVLARPP